MAAALDAPPHAVLRLAAAEDLPGILAIERVSFATPWTEKMFAEELKNEWSNVWVTEVGEPRRIVAFTVFWVAYDEIHVLNVAVAPEERRRGHGRLILRSIVAFGEHRRMSHVVLEVRPSNEGAQRLYQSLDFRPVGVRPRYYQDNGEDAILMVRMLKR
ncbi:MAG: ribosomal protein S18-alanine N-acetyltransferase [Deltaproteobacteria bacterium]|nr:ribosomal protein S18-alanine N-acetyltransferase [Deltaproteobacteria bacterium]